MQNEFTMISRLMRIELKSKITTRYSVDFKIFPSMYSKDLSSQQALQSKINIAYKLLISDFNDIFEAEKERIINSLADTEIKSDKDSFIKYIEINYGMLKNLSTEIDIAKFNQLEDKLDYYYKNFKEYTQLAIKSLFQHIFIQPLINIMELKYKEILISCNLISSPFELFINFISSIKVVSYILEENRSNWHDLHKKGQRNFFIIEINSISSFEQFNDHLKSLYINFKNHLKKYSESKQNNEHDKIKFLNVLNIDITELLDQYNKFDHIIVPEGKDPHYYSFNETEFIYDQYIIESESMKSMIKNYSTVFINTLYAFTLKSSKLVKFYIDLLNKSYPSNQIQEIENNPNSVLLAINKLQWRAPINRLVTIFYELSHKYKYKGQTALEYDKETLSSFLLNNFTDKDGNKLSKDTISTILTPSREDKRPSEDKRYKIPPME